MSNLQEGLIYLGKKYKAVNFGTEINVFGEKLIGFVNAKVGTSFPIITVPVAQEWLDKHFEEEAGRGVARIFHIDNSRRFGALGLSNLHVGSSNPVQFLDLPEYSIGNNWVIQGRIGVNKEEIAIRNIGPAIKDAREGRVTGLFEQYVGGAGLRTRANYRLGGVILVFTVETAVQKSPSTGAAEIQGTGSTIINF